jgi:hypothetical protein
MTTCFENHLQPECKICPIESEMRSFEHENIFISHFADDQIYYQVHKIFKVILSTVLSVYKKRGDFPNFHPAKFSHMSLIKSNGR